MVRIFFIFTTFTILSSHLYLQTSSAHLEIMDLNDNPGIVALKLGTAFIKKGYDWLVHIFELKSFRDILHEYEIIINQINSNNNTKDFKDILKMKFTQTSLSLQRISPRRKTKRAIDILGTFIKTITGNLDNNDLVNLNQKISFLEYSNQELVVNNNEQIKINNVFQQRINNLTKFVKNEKEAIDKLTNQIRTDRRMRVSCEQAQHFQRLIFNLDVIQRQLDDISDSIVMAKVGVLSKSILTTMEIDHVTEKLEKAGISIRSDEQVYEFLEPAAFYNGSCIMFLIKIPKFLQGNYQQIIVESVPSSEGLIPIDFTHAVLGTNVTYVMNDTCINIEQNIICESHTMKNVSSDICLHNLLRGNPSSCPFQRYNAIQEITPMGSGKILIRNALRTVQLENSCGYGPKNLTGSFLITFRNCSIKIENEYFENTQYDYNNVLEILPLQSTLINKSKTVLTETETLQELNVHNRKRIERLEMSNHHISFGGTIIIIIIVIGYLLKQIRDIWMKTIMKTSDSRTVTENTLEN